MGHRPRNTAKFGYPAEKLNAARRSLMAPHPRGEAASFASAFLECDLGLKDLTEADLDDDAAAWVRTIRETMDTRGIKDPAGRGTWTIKAEGLTEDEMFDFSSAVDELAHWFHYRFSDQD